MTPMTGLEIITIPFQVWQAPVGSTFPAIDVAPASPWVLMGLNGIQNMGEKGVIVKHSAKYEDTVFRTLGDTGPWKAVRTDEDLTIEFELMDLTLETYAQALDATAFDTTAPTVVVKTTAPTVGEGGFQQMGMYRGITVQEWALLVRGPSPYLGATYAQYELDRCYQSADPAPTFSKKSAGLLMFTYKALMANLAGTAGAAQRFGRITAQNAAKSSS